MVLDLDETLMDNRAYFVIYKQYDPVLWDQWIERAEAPAIPETLAFTRWLKEAGFRVFFVTGRREHLRRATVKNLEALGVSLEEEGNGNLFMKPDDYAEASAIPFKRQAYTDIEKQGYTVLLMLGDQASDLQAIPEGHGEGFKLPNPIYQIP